MDGNGTPRWHCGEHFAYLHFKSKGAQTHPQSVPSVPTETRCNPQPRSPSKDRVTVSIWAQRNSGRFAHQSLTDIKKGPLFKKKHSFSFSWRRSGPAVFCGSPHLFHLHLQLRPFLTHQPILYLRAEISYVCSPLERKLFGEVGVRTVRPNPHLSPMMRLNPHPHPAHMGWRNLERGCRCSSASHAAHTAL